MEEKNCKKLIISRAEEKILNGSISIYIVIKHVLAFGSGSDSV